MQILTTTPIWVLRKFSACCVWVIVTNLVSSCRFSNPLPSPVSARYPYMVSAMNVSCVSGMKFSYRVCYVICIFVPWLSIRALFSINEVFTGQLFIINAVVIRKLFRINAVVICHLFARYAVRYAQCSRGYANFA